MELTSTRFDWSTRNPKVLNHDSRRDLYAAFQVLRDLCSFEGPLSNLGFEHKKTHPTWAKINNVAEFNTSYKPAASSDKFSPVLGKIKIRGQEVTSFTA